MLQGAATLESPAPVPPPAPEAGAAPPPAPAADGTAAPPPGAPVGAAPPGAAPPGAVPGATGAPPGAPPPPGAVPPTPGGAMVAAPSGPPNYTPPTVCPLTGLPIIAIPDKIPQAIRTKYRECAIYFIEPVGKFSRKMAKQSKLCMVTDGYIHIADMKSGVITRSFCVRSASEAILSQKQPRMAGIRSVATSKDADLLLEFESPKSKNDFLKILLVMVERRGLTLSARMLKENEKETYKAVMRLNPAEGGKQKYVGSLRSIKAVIDAPGLGEADKNAPPIPQAVPPQAGVPGAPEGVAVGAPPPEGAGAPDQQGPAINAEDLVMEERQDRQMVVQEYAQELLRMHAEYKKGPQPANEAEPAPPAQTTEQTQPTGSAFPPPQETGLPPWNERAFSAQAADQSKWDSCPNCAQMFETLLSQSAKILNDRNARGQQLGPDDYTHDDPRGTRSRRGSHMSSRSHRNRYDDRNGSYYTDDDDYSDDFTDYDSDSDTDSRRSGRRSRSSRRRSRGRSSRGSSRRSPRILGYRPSMPPVIVQDGDNNSGAVILQQQIMERDEYIRLLEKKVRRQRYTRDDLLAEIDEKEDELDHISALIRDKEQAILEARETVARIAADRTNRESDSLRAVASATVQQKELERDLEVLNSDFQREKMRRQQMELAILEHPRVPVEVKQLVSSYERNLRGAGNRFSNPTSPWRDQDPDRERYRPRSPDRTSPRRAYNSRAQSFSEANEADIDFLKGLLRQTVQEHKQDVNDFRRQMNDYDGQIRDAMSRIGSNVSLNDSHFRTRSDDSDSAYMHSRDSSFGQRRMHEDEQFANYNNNYDGRRRDNYAPVNVGGGGAGYSQGRYDTPDRRPQYY